VKAAYLDGNRALQQGDGYHYPQPLLALGDHAGEPLQWSIVDTHPVAICEKGPLLDRNLGPFEQLQGANLFGFERYKLVAGAYNPHDSRGSENGNTLRGIEFGKDVTGEHRLFYDHPPVAPGA
jgi:hypothetical protein